LHSRCDLPAFLEDLNWTCHFPTFFFASCFDFPRTTVFFYPIPLLVYWFFSSLLPPKSDLQNISPPTSAVLATESASSFCIGSPLPPQLSSTTPDPQSLSPCIFLVLLRTRHSYCLTESSPVPPASRRLSPPPVAPLVDDCHGDDLRKFSAPSDTEAAKFPLSGLFSPFVLTSET